MLSAVRAHGQPADGHGSAARGARRKPQRHRGRGGRRQAETQRARHHRADGRHVLRLALSRREGVHRDRRRDQGRPGPVHHRSHEDDEPDRGRQGRQGHLRSWPGTATRSNSASRCSSSNKRLGHAREGRHRQPRRDRAANPARLPRAGHQDRRRAFHGRLQPQARAARGRVGLHRAAAVGRQLSQHAGDHQRRGSHRLGRHPSRLRLPVGERRFRRARREERLRVHRPEGRNHPHHGRQGLGHPRHEVARRAVRARLRRTVGRGPGRESARRARHRLSGHHQGIRRRRRPRHACRAQRGVAVECRSASRRPRRARHSATIRSTWRSFSNGRGTSSSRCSPMARAT